MALHSHSPPKNGRMTTAAPSYTGANSSTVSKRTRSTRERSLRGTARGGQRSADAVWKAMTKRSSPGGKSSARARSSARSERRESPRYTYRPYRERRRRRRRDARHEDYGATAGYELVVGRVEIVQYVPCAGERHHPGVEPPEEPFEHRLAQVIRSHRDRGQMERRHHRAAGFAQRGESPATARWARARAPGRSRRRSGASPAGR